MTIPWHEYFSNGAKAITSSAIRDLLKVTERPEIISFAGGLPAPECFPTEELAAASEQIFIENPVAALQYGPTEGMMPLRGYLATQMQALGLAVGPEQVLVTSGSQQGLDLLGKLFLEPGALVAVEDPTYMGALQAWRPYQPKFLTIPVDADGLDVNALANHLAQGVRPRFLYLVSSFQNPTGVTLIPERRQALVELAAKYQLPIIEDDPYGELVYDGERSKPLAALDSELHGKPSYVIYLSTFSKLLAPGMRVGWMVAPDEVLTRIAHAKQGLDLHTSSLSQAVAYHACKTDLLARHVPVIRDIYHKRRDTMLAALAKHMPAGVEWTKPAGGMFIWLTLPNGLDSRELLSQAIEEQVVFVPGLQFYANGGGENTMRLNFSHPTAERISVGVERLGRVLRAAL